MDSSSCIQEDRIVNAQNRARLNWEIACERLRFTLDGFDGRDAQATELADAIELVRTALQALQLAFAADSASSTGPTDNS